jgi:hypothetical protein
MGATLQAVVGTTAAKGGWGTTRGTQRRAWERGRRGAYLLTVTVDGGTSTARAELQAQAPSADRWAAGRAWRGCCACRGREEVGPNYLDEESGGRGVEWFQLLGNINAALVDWWTQGRGWAVPLREH